MSERDREAVIAALDFYAPGLDRISALADLIAAARAEERTRCAAIADKQAANENSTVAITAAQIIARKIRSVE